MRSLYWVGWLLLLAGLGFSCDTISVRPTYEYYIAEVDVDADLWISEWSLPFSHYKTGHNFERDIPFERKGVEIAVAAWPEVELFVDLNDLKTGFFYLNDSLNTERYGRRYLNGTQAGLGVQSFLPSAGGWHLDWRFRYHYSIVEDSLPKGKSRDKAEAMDHGADLRVGPAYAFILDNGVTLCPHVDAGIHYLMGKMDQRRGSFRAVKLDYQLLSATIHGGFRLNVERLQNLHFAVDSFMGISGLRGFNASLGIRF